CSTELQSLGLTERTHHHAGRSQRHEHDHHRPVERLQRKRHSFRVGPAQRRGGSVQCQSSHQQQHADLDRQRDGCHGHGYGDDHRHVGYADEYHAAQPHRESGAELQSVGLTKRSHHHAGWSRDEHDHHNPVKRLQRKRHSFRVGLAQRRDGSVQCQSSHQQQHADFDGHCDGGHGHGYGDDYRHVGYADEDHDAQPHGAELQSLGLTKRSYHHAGRSQRHEHDHHHPVERLQRKRHSFRVGLAQRRDGSVQSQSSHQQQHADLDGQCDGCHGHGYGDDHRHIGYADEYHAAQPHRECSTELQSLGLTERTHHHAGRSQRHEHDHHHSVERLQRKRHSFRVGLAQRRDRSVQSQSSHQQQHADFDGQCDGGHGHGYGDDYRHIGYADEYHAAQPYRECSTELQSLGLTERSYRHAEWSRDEHDHHHSVERLQRKRHSFRVGLAQRRDRSVQSQSCHRQQYADLDGQHYGCHGHGYGDDHRRLRQPDRNYYPRPHGRSGLHCSRDPYGPDGGQPWAVHVDHYVHFHRGRRRVHEQRDIL